MQLRTRFVQITFNLDREITLKFLKWIVNVDRDLLYMNIVRPTIYEYVRPYCIHVCKTDKPCFHTSCHFFKKL